MYVKARVTPSAKKEYIRKTGEREFEIAVKEKAERNAANKRAVFLVARIFDISERAVRIVNGHRSPSKLIRLEDSVLKKQTEKR